MEYVRQSEKLSAARRCLMLPHSRGPEESIAEAFRECTQAFHRMNDSGLDDSARGWVAKIKELMNSQQPLTTDQQIELSRVVDELAFWFDGTLAAESGV